MTKTPTSPSISPESVEQEKHILIDGLERFLRRRRKTLDRKQTQWNMRDRSIVETPSARFVAAKTKGEYEALIRLELHLREAKAGRCDAFASTEQAVDELGSLIRANTGQPLSKVGAPVADRMADLGMKAGYATIIEMAGMVMAETMECFPERDRPEPSTQPST